MAAQTPDACLVGSRKHAVQSFKVLTEIWPQSAWVFAAKALAVVVAIRTLGRAAHPMRTFVTLIALFSKDEWRRNQAMKLLKMFMERTRPTRSRRPGRPRGPRSSEPRPRPRRRRRDLSS